MDCLDSCSINFTSIVNDKTFDVIQQIKVIIIMNLKIHNKIHRLSLRIQIKISQIEFNLITRIAATSLKKSSKEIIPIFFTFHERFRRYK